ncbi:MAG TPA: hypothetical protein DFR83_26635, partial [Deltaproteobacteria bacterium]|nr:hypothetical protein [Deltaproteobacteria bacterium]
SGGSGGSGDTYSSLYGTYSLSVLEYNCSVTWNMGGNATGSLQWDVDLTLASTNGCEASDTSGSLELRDNAAYFQNNYIGRLYDQYNYYGTYLFYWGTADYITGAGGNTYDYWGYGYAQ